jgi:hypothetical protein
MPDVRFVLLDGSVYVKLTTRRAHEWVASLAAPSLSDTRGKLDAMVKSAEAFGLKVHWPV